MTRRKTTTPKVKNVEEKFRQLTRKGKKTLDGDFIPFPIESHVQGITWFSGSAGDGYIVTHNDQGASNGFMIVCAPDGQKIGRFAIEKEDYNHPGGLQSLGDYVAIAVENSDYSSSFVVFYDLTPLSTGGPPKMLDLLISRPSGTGCVGFVDMATPENKKVFYVLAHSNGANQLYRSDEVEPDQGPESIGHLTKVGGVFGTSKFQGLSLVVGENGQLYVIGFHSTSKGLSYADWADLYRIDPTLGIGLIAGRLELTLEGGSDGVDDWEDVHCRWGAGLFVSSPDKISLDVTARNYDMDGKLNINWVDNLPSMMISPPPVERPGIAPERGRPAPY